jgi:hypothetical protein
MKNIVQYLQGSAKYIAKDKNTYDPIFKFVYKSPTSSVQMHENMLDFVKQEYPDLMNVIDTQICSIFVPNGTNKGYVNFIVAPKQFIDSG